MMGATQRLKMHTEKQTKVKVKRVYGKKSKRNKMNTKRSEKQQQQHKRAIKRQKLTKRFHCICSLSTKQR